MSYCLILRKETFQTMQKIFPIILLLAASAVPAWAQAPSASAREDLSGFPESQAVLYVNARRVTNEVMPKVMPAASYQSSFDAAKRLGKIDLRQIDYVIAGMRLTDAPSSGPVPAEFGLVVRGGFNAD